MAGLQLSGLASGLDWKTLVDQIMQLESLPKTNLRAEQSKITQKTDVLANLRTSLEDLQSAIKALGDSSVFAQRTAQLENSSSMWRAMAGAEAAPGNYSFSVTQIAAASRLIGNSDVGQALSSTSDVSGVIIGTANTSQSITEGEFTVNGARISVSASDSLEDVFDRIATATGGQVTATYDPGSDRVVLNGSGTIILGSANDTTNFLTALKLYNNGTGAVSSLDALGAARTTVPIAEANLRGALNADPDGNGILTINGVEIDYNVNTDSLSTLMRRINDSTSGVIATFDGTLDRFVLTNEVTGDAGIMVTDNVGGLAAALGWDAGTGTLELGDNASFSVNGGGAIISRSNTFDESVHGVAGISVTATGTGVETVTVSANTQEARSLIETFIEKYNAVQSFIATQTKITVGSDNSVTTGLFARDSEMNSLARTLRSTAFAGVTQADGTVMRLQNIGIDFQGTSTQLEITDSAALDEALMNDASSVTDLFARDIDGLSEKLDSLIQSRVEFGGAIDRQSDSLRQRSSKIDDEISALQRRLDARRSQLEAAFIAMERAQSLIQEQLQILTNAFGDNSSSQS